MRPSRPSGSPCTTVNAGTIVSGTALSRRQECVMGRYMLLWLLGVPIPLLAMIWVFGAPH
jgi:hypothetical protein